MSATRLGHRTATARRGARGPLVALFASLAFAMPVVAQRPDTAVAAAAVADTGTTSYEVAGIRVIQRQASNDVVAANLYLLGGVRQLTAATQGIEPFLLEASSHGTQHYPEDTLRRVMARLGTSIVVDPEEDWTMLGARATVSTFDSTWRVLADRLMHPTLDPAEVEQVRAQLLNALAQRKDSPEALVNALADSVAFAGHPYALDPIGTEASVAAITRDDLARYQATQMVKSRMLLVVVGNVPRADLERLVRETIGTLPAGDYRWTMPPPLPDAAPTMAIVPMRLPTNYILGYFDGPPASSPDYAALRIATAVLSGRMFNEIRVKRNLTYAVNAPFVERAVSAGGLYVTTVAPDTTLALMHMVVDELKSGFISPDGLEQLVQQFITEYFLDNETNADQADFLAQAQLFRGDWRYADRFVEELRKVTPLDVRRVANQYIEDVRFAYVGDPARVPAHIRAF
ncbi:MAG TPA: pitrilysin family protein [Gemmatimonadaceae bacterium]|nr:pitrilysin family protein [Gemmatimonadaceae bacterium]